MKILITGGSGLVGYALKQITKKDTSNEYIFLSSKDCDLTDIIQTNILFLQNKPDYVIHLAAYVGGLFKNMRSKVEMYENNTLININVLKCCHKYKVKKVISCLSTCIFPDDTPYPINETMLHNGPPHYSNDAYAYAKRMLEVHSKAYQQQHGDDFICIIPTNIYGENDNYSLEDGHVVPSLTHKCYLAKQNNEPFVVKGTGKPLRQFIYSQDLAEIILWCLKSYDKKDTLIVSVSEKDEISIKEVATLIAKEFDYQHKIKFDSSYSDGQLKKTADNSKLLSLNPTFKFTPIEIGIQKSVTWFQQHVDICRK
jgi:GDP-L-fucose synthase